MLEVDVLAPAERHVHHRHQFAFYAHRHVAGAQDPLRLTDLGDGLVGCADAVALLTAGRHAAHHTAGGHPAGHPRLQPVAAVPAEGRVGVEWRAASRTVHDILLYGSWYHRPVLPCTGRPLPGTTVSPRMAYTSVRRKSLLEKRPCLCRSHPKRRRSGVYHPACAVSFWPY